MTKQDLKQLILEVYIEENKKKNAAKESDVAPTKKKVVDPAKKKVVAAAKKKVVAPAKKDPDNKITPSLVRDIETQEKSNVFKGDKVDANLFKNIGVLLKRNVGRTLEESDVDKMLEDMQCDECCEEGMDAVGNEDPDINNGKTDGTDEYLTNRRKKIGQSINLKELKRIIEKAKNI